ncbi:hypothetical protein ACE0DR_22215 [Azotobacter sp. CWF10]
MKAEIEAFVAEYRNYHHANSEHYPLAIDDNSAGLWMEFFIDFMTSRKGSRRIGGDILQNPIFVTNHTEISDDEIVADLFRLGPVNLTVS